jgi:DNA-directed RNA polymerase sigma subunit (sigma70/sigma32)
LFVAILVLNSFAGCGAELNISCERVRQIQVMAFKKMKLSYGEQLVSFDNNN